MFALGVILGIVGVALLVTDNLRGPVPQWPVVIAAVGLVLLIAGPLIRLPLRKRANQLVYIGAILSLVAVPWFITAYPGWRPQASSIIGLYSLGMLVMALGGVFVPLLISGRKYEEEIDELEGELEELRRALEEAEADEEDLSRLVEQLRQDQADTAADEADLAARLRRLRESQARFEHYEDSAGEWRWRLRHRNGNIIADGGEGYASRSGAIEGIESVKRNAPNAEREAV